MPPTNVPVRFRPAAGAALVAAALALGACGGDEREFVEAVEVAESGLAGLSIVPPEAALSPLVLAPGESVDLALEGTTEAGSAVELSDEDRDWRSDDEAVGTVDRDGRFTARADGTTAVRVGVGGVDAPLLVVTVSSASLAGIDELQGPGAPDPCVAARYTAVGTFGDGTRRLLPDVAWSLPESTDGVAAPLLREPEDGTDGAIELVPRAPGELVLRAAARGETLDTTLEVPDSLRSIAITSPGLLRVGDRTDLSVTGTFDGDEDGATRTLDVTDSVDFAVDDEGFATVSNLDGSRGRFEGLRQGTGNVTASCGAVVSAPLSVTVGSGGDGSTGSGIAFLVGNREVDTTDDNVAISLTGDGTAQGDNRVELRVSTGEEYDEDEDITDEVTPVSSNDEVLRVDVGSSATFLVPLSAGFARVTVTRGNTTASFGVDVTF